MIRSISLLLVAIFINHLCWIDAPALIDISIITDIDWGRLKMACT